MSVLQQFARLSLRGLTCRLPSLVSRSQMARPPPSLSYHFMSTKADSNLGQFLTEEIAIEKENVKPLKPFVGFSVKQEGAELTLTKEANNEKLIVSLNVNHTVDSAEPDDGSQEAPEMKSRPNFEVDIVKSSGETLSFSCSFIHATESVGSSDDFDDVFAIDEVTMFEGENWSEKTYAVAGDILDGNLYDLFMGMLEERGINKDFVEHMSEYCSAYEHRQYIGLLEALQKFVK